ncbi:MAG: hypothetical protein Q4C20_12205 [Erysipelotrichaceae bacterium]|nr:hypothetical protein [Erysipelotrichaceae bacterium]
MIRFLYERLKACADEIHVDGLGNLIVTRCGQYEGPNLAVSAHADEVGFIIRKIEESGLLRFEKLGGHDDRILPAERVIVTSDNGRHPGVIGTISAHMKKFDNPQKIRDYRELYIDVGAKNKDPPAEPVVFHNPGNKPSYYWQRPEAHVRSATRKLPLLPV